MALFRKKEMDFEEDTPQTRKITKNLKDLHPENKKKRKEPPKPWSKKERIIVLIVLLVTTIISAILLLKNLFGDGSEKFRINLPTIDLKSINIFKGETIVIEKE